MSIAVSAVVKPSRLLFTTVIALCIGIVVAAGLIAFTQISRLPLYSRWLLAGSCILAAFFGLYSTIRTRKTFRIDISDIGNIQLEEYIEAGKFFSQAGIGKSKSVNLKPGSTIWPHLMLLQLQNEKNQITILPILRDGVGNDAFRALSIACRWIAAQNNRAENKQI